ncbi:SpoIID/LytB domain-containing protein [Dorea sp. AM58-8]|nr:SpoIID/LytB domain-containing protein [Dorea sp. AM58-8]
MTSGYGSVLHSSVSLAADSGLRLKYDGREEDWTGGVLTLLADDVRLKNGHLSAEPLNPDEEIRVESIERGRGIPSYQGKIEVWSGEEGMAVINELPMESYLCRVVPSEMPASYEMEALKAQAVCARSYAVRQMQDYAYPEYQAHVNDSVEYQVYNNSYPADTATQAVKDTTGQVVWYQGNVASTYYFSTSCGETTDMTAWGDEVNESNAYLQSISVCGDVGDYEKDLPWYQWTAEISSERMAALLSNYAGKDLGTLESVEVTRRGDGDVATELTAVGTGGSITVETENKIRTALGGSGYSIVRNDGQTVDSQRLLPSAFISIEKKANSYVIRGGGYGHGIGMSQNGANEMAKNGKNYMEILKLFYQNVEIR